MKTGRTILIAAVTIALLTLAPSIGPEWLSPRLLLNPDQSSGYSIYTQLRIPRVIIGFLVGGSLAASGVAFQGMFRNALASPFTLGISGGAAFGASLSLFLGLTAVGPMRVTAFFGLAGALVTVALVWMLALNRRSPALTILLCGVVLSFFFSSGIMLLQYLGDFAEVFRMTHWMLGTVEVVGYRDLLTMLPFVLFGLVVLAIDIRALDLLSLGDEIAQSKGVAVHAVQRRILLGVSLIVGGVVSVCGPIGFVGIIVPFFCRMAAGYSHRVLFPLSVVVGGVFLVACDTFSRTVFSPLELPVGVCTALIGAPTFLWMLIRRPLQML